ncbi:MAG TPA: MopE-related protein, partial [Polyangiales bacterium]|nr:MopE-related protein [Polyangiales bacterium]
MIGLLVGLGACSEPECQKDERKVGNRCVEIGRAREGGAETGEEEGETRDRDGSTRASDARASAADASERDERSDAEVVAAPDAASSPAACVPVAETCDGADNDCDGAVDEGVTNACGGCDVIEPSHAPSLPCDNGGQGPCAKPGTWLCLAGTTTCSAPDPTPSSEVCDNKDNDCDGVVDDGITKNSCGGCSTLSHAKNDTCDNGLEGECRVTGAYTCSSDAEAVACNAPPKAGSAEVCDGK